MYKIYASLLILVLLIGCKATEQRANTQNIMPTLTPTKVEDEKKVHGLTPIPNQEINTEQTKKNPSPIPSVSSTDVTLDGTLAMFSEGRVDTLPIEIGSDYNQLVSHLGMPKEEGQFAGGIYSDYGNLWVFYDAFSEKKEVTSFVFFEQQEAYKLKVGISKIEDIKKIFGNPEDQYNGKWSEDEDSKPNENEVVLQYQKGNYEGYFYTVDGILQQIYLRKKN